MPSASACLVLAASGSVLMTAHGTPSASRRVIHSSLLAVANSRAISTSSEGLFATRAALEVYAGYLAHSGRQRTFESVAKRQAYAAEYMIGHVVVSKDSNGAYP